MRILPGLFSAGTEDVRAWRCFVWRVFWHEGGALCHQIWAPVPLFWHPWRLQPTSTSSSLLGLLFLHLTKYQSHFSDTHDDDSHTQISPRPGLPTSSSDAHDDSTTSSSYTFEGEAHAILFSKGSKIQWLGSRNWTNKSKHVYGMAKKGRLRRGGLSTMKAFFSNLYCLCAENASELWNETVVVLCQVPQPTAFGLSSTMSSTIRRKWGLSSWSVSFLLFCSQTLVSVASSNYQTKVNLGSNWILTDNANRAIQGNVAMQVMQPGGQICN